MANAERQRGSNKRTLIAWLLTATMIGTYFALPDTEDTGDVIRPVSISGAEEEGRPEILSISPSDPYPGSSIVITFAGVSKGEPVSAIGNKVTLETLAHQDGTLVAQISPDAPAGDLKVRIVAGTSKDERRSKSVHLRVKPVRFRKAFRNLVGGFALLLLGIGLLSRGLRSATELESVARIARISRHKAAAVALGVLLGAVVQSSAASSGLLAGLVSSHVLGFTPAAIAFLGAQLGAATAPLIITGLIEPREGLLVLGLGLLWMALGKDRRVRAIGRLLLGIGFIAYGLHVLRPGFEPFITHPMLLAASQQLEALGPVHMVVYALVGALLAAVLQGPAPVIVLLLAVGQTTGHWDLRSALCVLAGAGLGAALGALLTAASGPRARKLAKLHLVLGLLSSAWALSTATLWTSLCQELLPESVVSKLLGERLPLEALGVQVAAAFTLSQLSGVVLLVPLLPRILRVLEARTEASRNLALERGSAENVVRTALLSALDQQREALSPLRDLALFGSRRKGRTSEHLLLSARNTLDQVISGPVLSLPTQGNGERFCRIAFAALQAQGAMEALLREAERLTDFRISALSDAGAAPTLNERDEAALREVHGLLIESLDTIVDCLRHGTPVDLEAARAREILVNSVEARARAALVSEGRGQKPLHDRVFVLQMLDAYESLGNQIYRLTDACDEGYAPDDEFAASSHAGAQ